MGKLFDDSWSEFLSPLLEQDFMRQLNLFLELENQQNEVYPPQDLIFNAFRLTPLDRVKVVILGQDPYHNIGQAHGLSFSVPSGIAHPPSLRNIFTELVADIPGFVTPESGDLSSWAKQGVLLLNATLSVRAHQAGSHQKKGWEKLTDQIISKLADELEHVVFILWGSFAHKKTELINSDKHLVLKSVHPSPLSAYRGFFGSKPFSEANTYLQMKGIATIDWKL